MIKDSIASIEHKRPEDDGDDSGEYRVIPGDGRGSRKATIDIARNAEDRKAEEKNLSNPAIAGMLETPDNKARASSIGEDWRNIEWDW